MRWTTDEGLPSEDSNWADTLKRAVHYENLPEPQPFAPSMYDIVLKENDIFYRYELHETQYPDNTLWRVILHNNGAYLLVKFGGAGHVFADRDWFCHNRTKKWRYTKVGCYTGKTARLAEHMMSWVLEFSRA